MQLYGNNLLLAQVQKIDLENKKITVRIKSEDPEKFLGNSRVFFLCPRHVDLLSKWLNLSLFEMDLVHRCSNALKGNTR